MTPALRYQAVQKGYGALQALKGVSFDIQAGEFFGLLGPNGAGKSTLINTTAGLVRQSQGSVQVMGYDTIGQYLQARRALGVVPQELVFDPFFNVVDMLRIQAGYYGCGTEVWPWIDELLERLELANKRNSTMRMLSGGMKRRVLIAQALVHKPAVVILDEPTAGVDVELRRTLWAFMRDLHRQGTTVVLTTHYLEEAQEMCGRIAILNQGELKALEPTERLLAQHPYRFVRVRLQQPLPEALQPLVVGQPQGMTELRLDTRHHSMGEVLAALQPCGIVDVSTREPTLEDIFVELTGVKK